MSQPHAGVTAPTSVEHGAVHALLAERVRFRFALDAASLADRLLHMARGMSLGPDQPLQEHLRRLSLDELDLGALVGRGRAESGEALSKSREAMRLGRNGG